MSIENTTKKDSKKKFQAKRIIDRDELEKYGCLFCYDRERTKSINLKKILSPEDLKKLDKKIKRRKNKRYMFCPHNKCPYADMFKGTNSFEEWLEKDMNISLSAFFNDNDFPKTVTYACPIR